jgi:predicted lipid-binding transport protein (Tim44 family)
MEVAFRRRKECNMKRILLSIVMVLAGAVAMAPDVDAKRMGGGGSSGMKRDMPARTTPDSTPAQQAPKQSTATPAQQSAAPAAGAAAAPKRSWMGPIAGLAAGLGLAALMSHLGLGEEFANILMLALLAAVAFFVVRWLLRRFGPNRAATGPQGLRFSTAGAGASARNEPPMQRSALPASEAALPAATQPLPASIAATQGGSVPSGFDSAAFERVAKLIFIRMQAANDVADAQDLRRFTTPEMFAAVQLDLQDRQGAAQQTDVVQLDAQVIDVTEEDAQQIVSVRFHGLIREQKDAPAEPFDEIWHLVRPVDGSHEWAIAGIAQTK